MIKPVGFQWNFILCMKDNLADFLSKDKHDKVSESSHSNYIELSLIKIVGAYI